MDILKLFQPSTKTTGSTMSPSHAAKKPVVIGLYGLPGSGKSYLLTELKKELSHSDFDFYEGSEVISSLVPGGLDAFQKLDESEKRGWRERAIDQIAKNGVQRQKIAIVTGHFMFWSRGDYNSVYTGNDMNTYTHIIYLDIPAQTLLDRRQCDAERQRQYVTTMELRSWQQTEIKELTSLCQEHGILFSRLTKRSDNHLFTASKLIQYSRRVATVPNSVRVDRKVSEAISAEDKLETVFVVDADKTLSTEDTSDTFWDIVAKSLSFVRPIHGAFSGPLGYREIAFLQATLMYEEAVNEEEFESICHMVASKAVIHEEFINIFRIMAKKGHTRALVVTCGIRRIWELILEREGLSETVKVIGGSRISDDIVVTPEVKAQIVLKLKNEEHLHVCAVGDSTLDLPMLEVEDEAIVVTGPEQNRSRKMDEALLAAIETRGLKARQVLLPRHVSPRLTSALLPQVHLDNPLLLQALHTGRPGLHATVWHATGKNAGKVLMSPTRDASVSGARLREAHGKIGTYLVWEFLSDALGVKHTQHSMCKAIGLMAIALCMSVRLQLLR